MQKKHIIIEVILCVMAIVSIPTLFAPFILAPLVFAYPRWVNVHKLYYIPLGFVGVGMLVLFGLPGGDWAAVLISLGLAAVAAGVGYLIGYLFWRARQPNGTYKKAALFVGLLIFLAPGIFIMDMFFGVLSRPVASMQIRWYIARNYSDFDLTVGRLRYNFKGVDFTARVYNRHNRDIWFTVTRSSWLNSNSRSIRDNFNTGSYWAGTLRHHMTLYLENEIGDVFQQINFIVRGVQAGQAFDLTATHINPRSHTSQVRIEPRIYTAVTNASAANLTAYIQRYHAIFIRYGIHVERYLFLFDYPPLERSIQISVPPSLVNDDLPAQIIHARANRNDSGVFNAHNFRYQSRMR